MTYSEFQADPAYTEVADGAAFGVVVVSASDPSERLVGATTNLNFNENFSSQPVEEGGVDGINEFPQGAHSGSLSFSLAWRPEQNDKLPTRQNYLNQGLYMVLVTPAEGRPGAGLVSDAFTGVRITSAQQGVPGRGNRSINVQAFYSRRYSGEEWAALTGNS